MFKKPFKKVPMRNDHGLLGNSVALTLKLLGGLK
jgi:hypothetical protein